jgi:hypothetical protein
LHRSVSITQFIVRLFTVLCDAVDEWDILKEWRVIQKDRIVVGNESLSKVT